MALVFIPVARLRKYSDEAGETFRYHHPHKYPTCYNDPLRKRNE